MIKNIVTFTINILKNLMPLAPHIEDDGSLADLVGDDEEGGGGTQVQLFLALILTIILCLMSDNF